MDKIDQERLQEQINIFNEETSKYPLLMNIEVIELLPIYKSIAYMRAVTYKLILDRMINHINELSEDEGVELIRNLKSVNSNLIEVNKQIKAEQWQMAFCSGV